MKTQEREKRMWWATGDTDVFHVMGYSCGPHHPDWWWCPAMGYSGQVGRSLFDTELEAKNKLASEIRERIAKDTETLRKLGYQP